MSNLPPTLPSGGRPRSAWKAVSVPAEHGGWGLTAEAILLGLLVRPSLVGGAIGLAALVAFVARTPLKLAAVDRRRRRRLERSILAERVAAGELALLAAAVAVAVLTAGPGWWIPIALSLPLFGVELSFDIRSRGRRLVPELCGAIGMGAVAAAIAVAGGSPMRLGFALWVILLARAIASVSYARAQVHRLKRKSQGEGRRVAVGLQVAACVIGVTAIGLRGSLWPASAALAVMAAWHLLSMHRPPVSAKRVGLLQAAAGLALVLVTAIAVRAF